jgi:hypothetical protein
MLRDASAHASATCTWNSVYSFLSGEVHKQLGIAESRFLTSTPSCSSSYPEGARLLQHGVALPP